MKRLVWVLVLIPFFMGGCSGAIDENVMRSVELTQTAMAYTPTPFSTANPIEGQILSLINLNLQIEGAQDPIDQLEHTIGASYTVVMASFVQDHGQVIPNKLVLEIRCECAGDGTCCNVEYTFVEITDAMKVTGPMLVSLIPENIHDLVMNCYDHKSFLGAMYVPWQAMKEFLHGATGYQLGGAVRKMSPQAP